MVLKASGDTVVPLSVGGFRPLGGADILPIPFAGATTLSFLAPIADFGDDTTDSSSGTNEGSSTASLDRLKTGHSIQGDEE